jgi:23S rRNA pseudouridine955/2504/2580 synthase
MQQITVTPEDDGIRLDRWFKRHYANVPFLLIAKLIRKGQIKLNSAKADIATKIQTDDIISFKDFANIERAPKSQSPIPPYYEKMILDAVIYKDDDIIVLNKPIDLAVQGGSGIKISVDDLAVFLQFEYDEKPKLVHRLDKETSGILILARKASVAAKLSEGFRSQNIHKEYIALVNGCPRPHSGKIDLPLEKVVSNNFEKVEHSSTGQKAVTLYKVLDHAADRLALVEFQLITGRTHQIRVHSASIGHPLIGDDKYGNRDDIPSSIEKKLYLHSYKTSFKYKNKTLSFKAQLPKHFKDAIKTLGLHLFE